eukprot:gene7617-7102_t
MEASLMRRLPASIALAVLPVLAASPRRPGASSALRAPIDPPKAFDCGARHLALEMAKELLAATPGTTQDVSDALRLQECPGLPSLPSSMPEQDSSSGSGYVVNTDAPVFYVAVDGDDNSGDGYGSGGCSLERPFASLLRASSKPEHQPHASID